MSYEQAGHPTRPA